MKVKLSCIYCSQLGLAEKIDLESGRIFCFFFRVPMFLGQSCEYSLQDLEREKLVLQHRLERIDIILQRMKSQKLGYLLDEIR